MAATLSTMLPLGTEAPDFLLPDTLSGKQLSLNDIRSDKGTVIVFICNHCPFVHHLIDKLVALANEFIPRGISFAAISSNDADQYPQDGPERMNAFAREHGFSFPYLYDESQDVAADYDAACTPDFYVFDGELRLVYRGQFDDSRPGMMIDVTGRDLRNALENLLSGTKIPDEQKPSIGCGIKWKKEQV